jgi:hypothetical protein
MVKHDIPNRPFMIVQSIDKLPVASGDRVALLGVTCIWFSSDLKLQKAGFPQRTLSKNQSMIRFTITSGKLVLDPNIVLFKDLQDLFNCAGPKFLQVIYYTHSTEPDNPFTGLDARVLEENILRAVFNKSTWKELKVPKATEDKFKLATDLFLMYNTPEIRMLKSIDKK